MRATEITVMRAVAVTNAAGAAALLLAEAWLLTLGPPWQIATVLVALTLVTGAVTCWSIAEARKDWQVWRHQ